MKLIDTSAKGARNEEKCEKELAKQGYSVEKVRRVKWNKRDFFSLFDVIAVSGKRIRLIQVKSNRMPEPGYRKRIHSFRCPSNCSKEIWIWVDYKGWKKWLLKNDGTMERIKGEK